MSELRDAALVYAARGWPVFPIKPRGKEPLTEHGFLDATTDHDQVEAWWARWPAANIGAACGHAFDVLDVDGGAAGSTILLDMLAEHGLPRDSPRDWTARAWSGGGGGHYFFQPGGPVRWRGFRPHLDWLGLRGYVILPPSIHPSGGNYRWVEGPYVADKAPEAFPPAPAWLYAAVTRPVREVRPPRDPGGDPEGRPGDDFNRRMGWAELLEADGARLERRQGDVEYWTRPDKPRGISASVGGGGHDLLYVFSGNWPKLEADTSYSKFAYWATTRHGGDFAAAAKDLAGQGYGEQKQNEQERDRPRPRAPADLEGAALLDQVADFIGRYVAFGSPAARDAVTLWAAHCHTVTAFESTPRLALLSAEKGSGKTRTLEVLELLVPRPMHAVSATAAALFRAVEATQPSLLFDEADTFFGPMAKGDHEELRALVNAGHRKGAVAYRCFGDPSKMEVRAYPAFCAVALAGIGDLPPTILDRAVLVRMRRRAPDEQVEPFRRRKAAKVGDELREALADWMEAHADQLADAEPEMPAGLVDRPADVWEALLAVADAAGGNWPRDARRAALELNAARVEADPSLGIALLRDVRAVWDGVDGMPTEELLKRLTALDESPWGDLRGKPLDARGLARRLRPYEVRPTNVRAGDDVRKGYLRADLHDAWSRYLPLPEPSATSATSVPAAGQGPAEVAPVADVAPSGETASGALPGFDPDDPARWTR